MPNIFPGIIREVSPCKGCPKKDQRPACRKGCPEDAAWHEELERVKANQREHVRRINIGFDHLKNGGKQ